MFGQNMKPQPSDENLKDRLQSVEKRMINMDKMAGAMQYFKETVKADIVRFGWVYPHKGLKVEAAATIEVRIAKVESHIPELYALEERMVRVEEAEGFKMQYLDESYRPKDLNLGATDLRSRITAVEARLTTI